MRQRFVFDVEKSRTNEAKHGIDFVEAQALWLDKDLIRIQARSEGERRFIFVGRIHESHWSAIVTATIHRSPP